MGFEAPNRRTIERLVREDAFIDVTGDGDFIRPSEVASIGLVPLTYTMTNGDVMVASVDRFSPGQMLVEVFVLVGYPAGAVDEELDAFVLDEDEEPVLDETGNNALNDETYV